MQNDKKSLERREFLKTSAKFGAMASLASLSGFALSACDSKDSKKDSARNIQSTQNAGESQMQNHLQGETSARDIGALIPHKRISTKRVWAQR